MDVLLSGIKFCKVVMLLLAEGPVEDVSAEHDLVADIVHTALGCIVGLKDIIRLKKWGEAIGVAKIKSVSVGNLFMRVARDTQDLSDKLSLVMAAASAGNSEGKRMAIAGLVERLRFVQSIRLDWSSF